MYGSVQPTMGAWFQATLMRIKAPTPTVPPMMSSCFSLSTKEVLDVWASTLSGMISCAAPARKSSAMANDQKAHGHQASSKTPAMAHPRTAPPGAMAPKSAKTMCFRGPSG